LCVFRPTEVAEFISNSLLGFRFSGRRYSRGGAGRGRPGRPHHWVARPRTGPRHLVAHLALSFWLLPSSDKI
jgi:hypothetical protein